MLLFSSLRVVVVVSQTTNQEKQMGYSIYIGNAVVESNPKELTAFWTVEKTSHPDAPLFSGDGDVSGNTNGRHPSYSSMKKFAKATGLDGLFFGDDGLFAHSVGINRLTPDILDTIRKAREEWEKTHPFAIPSWTSADNCTLAKLLWYEWWIKWALENCENPAIDHG